MPKLKTKSSAKKRFRTTAKGHVIAGQANKRHNMRKRSKRQLRNQRGTEVLNAIEEARVLKNYLPYN
jgi:large subunit ribosomal protein L35